MMRPDRATARTVTELITAEREHRHDDATRIFTYLVDDDTDAYLLAMLLASQAARVAHLISRLIDSPARPALDPDDRAEHVAAIRLIVAVANDDLAFAKDLAKATVAIGQAHATQVLYTLLALAAAQPEHVVVVAEAEATHAPMFGPN